MVLVLQSQLSLKNSLQIMHSLSKSDIKKNELTLIKAFNEIKTGHPMSFTSFEKELHYLLEHVSYTLNYITTRDLNVKLEQLAKFINYIFNELFGMGSSMDIPSELYSELDSTVKELVEECKQTLSGQDVLFHSKKALSDHFFGLFNSKYNLGDVPLLDKKNQTELDEIQNNAHVSLKKAVVDYKSHPDDLHKRLIFSKFTLYIHVILVSSQKLYDTSQNLIHLQLQLKSMLNDLLKRSKKLRLDSVHIHSLLEYVNNFFNKELVLAQKTYQEVEKLRSSVERIHKSNKPRAHLRSVGITSNNNKKTFSGELEMVICPKCATKDAIVSRSTLKCSKCGYIFTKDELIALAKLENIPGVLLDFNIGNDYKKRKLHLVLDHHDMFADKITDTGTSRVIEYLEAIKFAKKSSSFSGYRLVKKVMDSFKPYTDNHNLPLHLFVNHIDMDVFLAHFSLRNPNFALEHKDKLILLSQYGDLFKITDSLKDLYITLIGLIEHYSLKLGTKDYALLMDLLVREAKKVFLHPSRYKIFYEEERLRRKIIKTRYAQLDDYFKEVDGLEHLVVLFKQVESITRHQKDVIFEMIKNRLAGAFNLPLLLFSPVIFKVKVDGVAVHTYSGFHLSVNPNVDGWEKINLKKLRPYFDEAELKMIDLNRKDWNRYLNERAKLDEKFDGIKSSKTSVANSNFFSTLNSSSQDEIVAGVDNLINLAKSESYSSSDYITLLSELKSQFQINKNKSVFFKNSKRLTGSLFSVLRKINEVEIKHLDLLLAEFNKNKIDGKSLDAMERAIKRGQLWIAKPNLLFNNVAVHKSFLSYDNIISILKKHKDLLQV